MRSYWLAGRAHESEAIGYADSRSRQGGSLEMVDVADDPVSKACEVRLARLEIDHVKQVVPERRGLEEVG